MALWGINGSVSPILSAFTGGACAPESRGNSMATKPIKYFMKYNFGIKNY
jgi:hypothetical protein